MTNAVFGGQMECSGTYAPKPGRPRNPDTEWRVPPPGVSLDADADLCPHALPVPRGSGNDYSGNDDGRRRTAGEGGGVPQRQSASSDL